MNLYILLSVNTYTFLNTSIFIYTNRYATNYNFICLYVLTAVDTTSISTAVVTAEIPKTFEPQISPETELGTYEYIDMYMYVHICKYFYVVLCIYKYAHVYISRIYV
jgi:hypothetical protein